MSANRTNKIEAPSISLPKGGGAIKGLGETFQPDHFSGSGSYSVPFQITKARSLTPGLALSYHSGAGNSPFGIGFDISLPKITTKTQKGIPKYDGSNIFIYQGQELIKKKESVKTSGDWSITQYLPRLEHDFSKIEHYLKKDHSESYWKITTSMNVVSIFGSSDLSRISNANNDKQIFEWLIDSSKDAKGNKVKYTYKKENTDGIGNGIWTKNHNYNNRYISGIQYGNYIDQSQQEQFAFEVRFDYGEHDLTDLDKGGKNPYTTSKKWTCRKDPFSTFIAGFEIRTCRICRNILLFHNFKNELGDPTLIKRLALSYYEPTNYGATDFNGLTSLQEAKEIGYRRLGKVATDKYELKASVPLNFGFSTFAPSKTPSFQELSIDGGGIPGYLSSYGFQTIDLDQEGLTGLFYNNGESLFYSEPLGEGEYTAPLSVGSFPINRHPEESQFAFTDLESKGNLDLVVKDQNRSGYYEKEKSGEWKNFIPFPSYPTTANTQHTEFAGLSNTGHTDLLVAEEANLRLFKSRGKDGYDAPENLPLPNGFPLIKKGYKQEYVGFANVFGDGLSHRIKIANGTFECWPDLGYGRFAEKIALGNAPYFGEDFDTTRLFFADIDGSGTMDLAYAHPEKVEVFLNSNGNYFSEPITIKLPDLFDPLDHISFADVLGNGSTCLVFTKAGPTMKHYYYNFIGTIKEKGGGKPSLKPYLLNTINNNLGGTTEISYCSSVKFYLEDKKNGVEWPHRLSFPVQLVEKMTVTDEVTKTHYSHSFKYHDGYYDRIERKFRGFGMVESWDTEEYTNFGTSTGLKKENYVPPVHTKTWYNTGAYSPSQIDKRNREHYFQGDKDALDFPHSLLEDAIYEQGIETIIQAHVAMAGQKIRSEVYGLDKELNPELVKNPFTVSESCKEVQLVQALGENPYAVFLIVPREDIAYNYERNPEDPQVNQSFYPETDKYGNVKQSVKIFLPRRAGTEKFSPIYTEQQQLNGMMTVNSYVTPLEGFIYNQIACENQSLQLHGLNLNDQKYFSFNDIKIQATTALTNIIRYGETPTPSTLSAGQLSWTKNFFWNDDQTKAWNQPCKISKYGLVHHHESAFLTKELTINNFDKRLVDENSYQNDAYFNSFIYTKGGYFYDTSSKYWWNKGMVQHYYDASKPEAFFQTSKTENTFAFDSQNGSHKQDLSLCSKTTVTYDSYFLAQIGTTQYLDDSTQISTHGEVDYNFFKTRQTKDANENISQVLFDPLGQVIVTSTFGTVDGVKAGGMSLFTDDGSNPDYQPVDSPTFSDIISNPKKYLQGASTYFFYDLESWQNHQLPANALELIRNDFWLAADQSNAPYCQTKIQFSDGLGRVVESKESAALERGNPRWRVTGRKVYNNKGKVYEEYLPYFSDKPEFENWKTPHFPPPKVTHYDALGRVIRVDSPKGYFSKTEITPWQQVGFDHNDTIYDSSFYQENYPGTLNAGDQYAIEKSLKSYNTPGVQIYDNTGSPIRIIENNLGNVSASLFEKMVAGSGVTGQNVVDELTKKGYLLKEEKTITNTTGAQKETFHWITEKFSSYQKGFTLNLDSQYKSFIPQIITILHENQLTTFQANDITGRNIQSIDPRLYYANVTDDKTYSNFDYTYAMAQKKPFMSASCDGGTKRFLLNIFGKQVFGWSSRDYCQISDYDALQRKVELYVKKMEDSGPIVDYSSFNLVEKFTYGESIKNSTKFNLNGMLYQTKDLSGISTNKSYDLLKQVLKNSKEVVKTYKKAVDWKTPPKLTTPYTSSFRYNAVQKLVQQTTPDSSVIDNCYNEGGFLKKVEITPNGSTKMEAVSEITYDARGQRNSIEYGNKVITTYTYEETTLLLASIISTRPKTGGGTENIQYLEYYYDPVANVMQTKDTTIDDVYHNNQQVQPVMKYVYDSLYRLTNASGRQHKGINANTYKNNASDNSFMQCIYGPKPSTENAGELENYTETFTYDTAGNLTKKQHNASTSWTRNLPVNPDSNRLSGLNYDESGNLRQLDLNSSVNLSFNCCENLVKAAVIERPGEKDDADYYVYNSGEQRVLKVSERFAHGATTSQIDQKIYLGNYEVLQTYQGSDTSSGNLKNERHNIRIMDDKKCVLIINYSTVEKKKKVIDGPRKFRYQMDNNIGSVSLELDDNAALISYEEYFPYGGTAIITGENQAEVKLKEYRYSGKERDNTTGLYYYGYRYYAPWMGRWLKPDPAGTVDGLNVYAFVKGNPITLRDVDGRMFAAIPLFIGGASTAHMSYQVASEKGLEGPELAGWTIAGGIFGAATGGVGARIAMSMKPLAQTVSMMVTSTVTSGVLSEVSSGAVDTETSVGAVSVNWRTQEISYPFKPGNTWVDNVALLAGLTGNTSDVRSLFKSRANVKLVTEFDWAATKRKEIDLIGHSAIVGDKINISVGPRKPFFMKSAPLSQQFSDLFDVKPGKLWPNYHGDPAGWSIPIYNVDADLMRRISKSIAAGKDATGKTLSYSGICHSCTGHASDALTRAAVLPLASFGLHPYILHGLIGTRHFGLVANPFMFSFHGTKKTAKPSGEHESH